jgi:8-oxo-dGTP pyrophosphatase MutT (NUDIX family)
VPPSCVRRDARRTCRPLPFRKLGETGVWRGSVVSAALARWQAPDGEEFERDVIHHPGAVSVVPMLDDDTVLLVRQFRTPIERELLEIPAGKRDVEGEPPETTAHRELVEEVGMAAGRLEHLVRFWHSPGFCDEEQIVFVATELRPASLDLQGIEEQHMTTERVSLQDVPGLIAAGDLADAKTIIALLLVRESRR